ncbi:MAG: DUF1573 domain-containing protein [Gemmataceae bacterium]
MLRYSLVLIAGFYVAGSAGAATWADGLFDELSKDFGSVPRGPAQKHNFRVVNKTKQAVNVSNVRVSCGCVTAFASPKTFLQPGEETTIVTSMDTTRFTGAKSVTVYVQFDRPNFEEVRLWVQANGRNDFMLSPDTFALGQVKRGTTPTSTIRVTFYGNRDAKIESAKGESNYIEPLVKEVHRLDTGEVAYDVTAKLRSDTPVGKWYTDVWLKTNIASMTQVRVPLTVEVESPLTITPSLLALGNVKKDEEAVRRIIVRGVQPFTIKEVKGSDAVVEVKPASKEAREVHVLSVRTKSGKAGTLDRSLRVITDLKADGEIDFRVQATITE